MNVEYRLVERFPEPEFSALVRELMHEPGRDALLERLFPGPAEHAASPPSIQRIRLGAYEGDKLIGWTSGWREPGDQVYAASSAVLPQHRRRGVYTGLLDAVERHAREIGCVRIASHQRADNAPVLIAKLKAGYVITGTEFDLEMGLLVRMTKILEAKRAVAMGARAGPIERAFAFFNQGTRQPGE